MSVCHSSSSVLCAGVPFVSLITGDAGAVLEGGCCGRVWGARAEIGADGAEPKRVGAGDEVGGVEDVRQPDVWGGAGVRLIILPRTARRRDS